MGISFNGYNAKIVTFYAGEACEVGKAVTINEDGEAVCAGNNNRFIGICTSLRNGIAGVQVEGYVELPYSGTAPKHGVNRLICDANGCLTASIDDIAQYYKILKVDTDSKTVGFIL